MKELYFNCCYNLKELHVDAPNLLSFKIAMSRLPILSINVPCTWHVCITDGDGFDPSWYFNLKKFLSAANQIVLHLTISRKNVYNINELRSSTPSLPVKVDELHLYRHSPRSMWTSQLEDIFHMCYPQRLCLKIMDHTWISTFTRFAQWFFWKMYKEEASCCDSRLVKCWRHYLKDMKVDFIPLEEDETVPPNWKEALHMLPSGHMCYDLSWYYDYVDETN